MTAVIQTQQLTKTYGSHRGIVEVDLDVNEGEVFGFLGPNGAGKTTMIRTLLDHIRPTSGRAMVFGIETTADPVAIHRRIGYLPGEFVLYDKLTGGQTHRVLRQPAWWRRHGLPGRIADRAARPRPVAQVQGVLEGQQAEDRPGHRAPASAGPADARRADLRPRPAGAAGVLLRSFGRPRPRAGRSSCLSHILSEVEHTCDRVAIIREGRLVARRSRRGTARHGASPGRAQVHRRRTRGRVRGAAGGDATCRRGSRFAHARLRPDDAGGQGGGARTSWPTS